MSNAKFRSWNKEDKCFYYFLNGGYFTESGEVAKRWRFDWENSDQYTGLKDKNGVEIYEGDIVFQPSWWWGAGCVVFHNDLGDQRMMWITEDGNHRKTHNIWDFSEIQVIGNIHQNPELLKTGE